MRRMRYIFIMLLQRASSNPIYSRFLMPRTGRFSISSNSNIYTDLSISDDTINELYYDENLLPSFTEDINELYGLSAVLIE